MEPGEVVQTRAQGCERHIKVLCERKCLLWVFRRSRRFEADHLPEALWDHLKDLGFKPVHLLADAHSSEGWSEYDED